MLRRRFWVGIEREGKGKRKEGEIWKNKKGNKTWKGKKMQSLCAHGIHKLDIHNKAVQKWSEK